MPLNSKKICKSHSVIAGLGLPEWHVHALYLQVKSYYQNNLCWYPDEDCLVKMHYRRAIKDSPECLGAFSVVFSIIYLQQHSLHAVFYPWALSSFVPEQYLGGLLTTLLPRAALVFFFLCFSNNLWSWTDFSYPLSSQCKMAVMCTSCTWHVCWPLSLVSV